MNKLSIALSASLIALATAPMAATIGFEDVTTSTTSTSVLSAPYQGFDWTSIAVIFKDQIPGSGYQAAATGNYVAFAALDGASMASTTDFVLTSMNLATAFAATDVITVTGFDDGVQVAQQDVAVTNQGATLATFGWTVDQITFFAPTASQMVIDEVVIADTPAPVPLPASFGLLAVALGGVVALKRRERRDQG